MRAASIESTLLWTRQRASRWQALAVLVGCAVAVAAALAVGATDGAADGDVDASVVAVATGDAVGAEDAVVAPVPQAATRMTMRPLRSARRAIS